MPKVYKSDEDKLQVYRARLSSAKKAFEKWKPDAERWVRRYRGTHYEPEQTVTKMGHEVAVTTGQGNIDAMHSALTAVEIAVAVNHLGHGTYEQARLGERAIMETWYEQKINSKSEYVIKDALLVGLGWLKVGYDYESHFEEGERPQEDIDADVDVIFKQAAAEGLPPPDPEAVASTVPLVENVEVIDRDRVVVDYVPWNEVLVDPSAKRPEDIRWLIHKTVVPTDEVRSNPIFREYVDESGRGLLKKLDELEPDMHLSEDMTGRTNPVEDDERTILYEAWDFVNGTFCTFTDSLDFLLNEQVNPLAFHDDLIDRNPFVPLVLRASPDSLRGLSDMELMEPSLNELEFYRSQLANFLERVKGKIAGPENALGPKGEAALESQELVVFVPLENGVGKNEIGPLEPPAVPSEVFGMEQRIENQIREATGVSELMRGLFPDRKRTATETAEVVAASSARQSEKRNRLETFYTEVARRILFYVQLFYDNNRISRIMEDFGDVEWEWNNEDVAMDADLRVELSAKEPKNYQTRKEEAMTLINLLGPLADPSGSGRGLVDLAEVLKSVLLRMGFGMDEIRNWLNLPEEQQQQQMQELQRQANEAVAAEGVPPSPDSVPGPLPGDALARAANQGEVPAELFPGPVDAALARGQYGEGALDYIVGP